MRVETKVENIEVKIDSHHETLLEKLHFFEDNFVSKHEFKPIQKIVYGLLGVGLAAVVTGLLRLLF